MSVISASFTARLAFKMNRAASGSVAGFRTTTGGDPGGGGAGGLLPPPHAAVANTTTKIAYLAGNRFVAMSSCAAMGSVGLFASNNPSLFMGYIASVIKPSNDQLKSYRNKPEWLRDDVTNTTS